MDELDRQLIAGYMAIGSKQHRQKKRLTRIWYEFWNQSFTHCPQNVDENGNSQNSLRYDKQVDAILDMASLIENNQRVLNFKNHYWQRYLNTLETPDRAYLVRRYRQQQPAINNDALDRSALNECNQIEEAAGYRFGIPADKAVDVVTSNKNIDAMMNQVLGMIG